MKIGILTQPLHNNYGGLLQCYALQTMLQRMGHEAWVLQRMHRYELNCWRSRAEIVLKNVIKRLIGREACKKMSDEQKQTIGSHTRYFAKKYINPRTEAIYSTHRLKQVAYDLGIEAYVVGSDQVWRPMYSPCITNYFIDFDCRSQVKRIAYAASFGVAHWEFTRHDTKRCAALIKHFDAVSVREASGVDLCKRYLGVKAQHVLDPTLLLDRADYERLVANEHETPRDGSLFCYILDKAANKQQVIESAARATALQPFYTMPELEPTIANVARDIEACVFPAVTAWLRSFMDAKMVVTDSFHGCVFSIIFNKPFWVIGNAERGMARFKSLLSQFGLEERMISVQDIATTNWQKPIDWQRVNARRDALRVEALQFLQNSLTL